MKTEVMSFRQDLTAGQSLTITENVKDNGEVIEVRLRFYPGQERSLKVRPYVQLAEKMTEDLFTWAGNTNGTGSTDTFVSGDDDYFTFPVNATVNRDDKIAVWASNTDTTYTYTLCCDVVIQYYG